MTPTDKKLYELFSNKTLSEGCKVKAIMFGRDEYFTCIGMRKITEGVGIYQYDKFEQDGVPIEILGHEPRLEDVFRVGETKGFAFDIINFGSICGFTSLIPTNQNFNIPYNPTLSLLSQSDETKLAIINLFTND